MTQISTKIEVKNLFQEAGLRPSKGFGQNFLVDKSILKRIVEAAEISPKDTILEIGPGLGILTQELAQRSKMVIAVEKDPKMCEILEELLKGWNVRNIKIINGDILKLSPIPSALKNYKVVANLPYYITSPVIRKFLESENPPEEMILMVQKEVAQRICAAPPNMSLLAVSVQFYAEPKIIFYVSKKSFWPQPKVDSAIIKISEIENYKLKINKDLFFTIVRAGFSQPRKQLLNNLSKGLELNKESVKTWLLKNKITPNRRAETLNVGDWIKLTKTIQLNCLPKKILL